jgi:flagellar hook-basal body complex protein FliE
VIIPPIGSLAGSGLSLGAAEAAPQAAAAEAAVAGAQPQPVSGAEAGAETPNFGGALTEAISSLEGSQRSADSAAQALASGTVKDPESAVTTVEDAAMAMQLAAQIRQKATEAAQTIFQTQV